MYIQIIKCNLKNVKCKIILIFKSFIRHIHNYTEYNQQWNISQVRSMDSAIIWNTNTRENT